MGLHMNGGQGETSYANNSLLQRGTIYKTQHSIQEAISLLSSNKMPKSINIADLGCSSGPNSLLPATMILDAVQDSCAQLGHPIPDCHIYLNDLPENDFHSLFQTIPSFLEKLRAEKGDDFGSFFIYESSGSFYGRLFPEGSLHVVYSASSLHWLSQAPSSLGRDICNFNKGNIALGMTSPPDVYEAYLEQFQRDFLIFLKSRSQGIVPKGCMVLSLNARRTIDPFDEECLHGWDDLADVLRDMVEEGIVEEEKMNSFNMPYYEPHIEEVREIIKEEGSFDIIKLEEPRRDTDYVTSKSPDINIYNVLANCARAITEPILSSHFGPAIIDELFQRLEEKLAHAETKETVFLVLSLVRKG